MASNLDLSNITGKIENTLSTASMTTEEKSRLKSMRAWFQKKRMELKPWSAFLKTSQFSKPKNVAEISQRVVSNLKIYQANYIIICILLALYCIITSPLLLFGLSMSLGGCYYISSRGQGQPIKLFGRQFSVTEQYGLVFIISLPLFFLASAGSTVFWIIGASIFIIIAHASMLSSASGEDNIDIEMNSVNIQ